MMYKHPKNNLKIYLPNIMKQIFVNSKKPVGGLCASQDWSQKIPLEKSKKKLQKEHFAQTPSNSKKMHSKSEK